MPSGVIEEDFINYAMDRFQKRYERIEKASGATLAEVYRAGSQSIDADE